MKTIGYHCLFIGLIWLINSTVWAQTPSVLSGKSAEATASQDYRPLTGDSLQLYQLLDQKQTTQSGHQQLRQVEVLGERLTTLPTLVTFIAILGAILFMSLFMVAQYFLNRDESYGWYAIYLTLMSIWLWQAIRFWFSNGLGMPNLNVFSWYMLLLNYGMLTMYARFISSLLEIPQQQPRLKRWLRYFFGFVALSTLLSTVELFVWNSLRTYILIGILNYGAVWFMGAEMLRSKHPLKPYAVSGSLLIMCGTLTSFLANYIGNNTTNELINNPLLIIRLSFFIYIETTAQLSKMLPFQTAVNQLNVPLLCIAIGRLLEMLCYSLALGRRSHLNKEERLRVQHQLIQQLEENQHLQQTHTVELEHQLAQRTTEVLTQAHKLEEQRINQLRSDFDRRAAEAEMAGLRSQMNPHFIFNCLNSIKLYAVENDSEKASEYLTKFSRLIRQVLENSRSERVTLQNELETLHLYMDMEAMRFKQKLAFRIDVAPDVDAKFLEIPPLLIQPYVENAIWHGLMHKPTGGTVHVQATLPQEALLHLTITDDGVGRTRSAELKSKSASHRKSFGLKMTSERISLVNQLYHTQTQVTIHDLIDDDGQPAGTEVTIQIPI